MVTPLSIECDRLAFRIGDFRMADLFLRVGAGEYFVLSGANGSGKTLLLRLLLGLCRPIAGTIRLGGKDMAGVPPWKRGIGYVPQDCFLFPRRTVRENIAFGMEVRHVERRELDEQVDRMACLLHIESLLKRMPAGLSGGERQKVAVARALAYRPSVLLLDEPVSAIDEPSRDTLCGMLKSVQRQVGVTTIHVSHNSRETELVADRTGVMVRDASGSHLIMGEPTPREAKNAVPGGGSRPVGNPRGSAKG